MSHDPRSLLIAAAMPRETIDQVLADAKLAQQLEALLDEAIEPPPRPPSLGMRSGSKHIKVKKVAWETAIAAAVSALSISDPSQLTTGFAVAQLVRFANVLRTTITSLDQTEMQIYDAVAVVSKKLREAIGSANHSGATEGEIAAHLKQHAQVIKTDVLKNALASMCAKSIVSATHTGDQTYYRPVF